MKAIKILKEYRNIDFGCDVEQLHSEINEAIAELEAIQNRSCESCKHWDSHTTECKCIPLDYNYHGNPSEWLVTDKDFYCKYYERKEDDTNI